MPNGRALDESADPGNHQRHADQVGQVRGEAQMEPMISGGVMMPTKLASTCCRAASRLPVVLGGR
jgi:hypothetical protein